MLKEKITVTVLAIAAATVARVSEHLGLQQRQALSVDQCPGYVASNVQYSAGLVVGADLRLAGAACNAYGTDLTNLRLDVEYQAEERLHVKIYDAAEQVYQVPSFVLPRPSNGNVTGNDQLVFSMTADPFTFAIARKGGETLFHTSGAAMIFESQYLRLRTQLPQSPHLYGLGEHTDPFMLNTTNYTRTLWSRDAGATPPGTNLYGNHPIYFDHRGAAGTHGVFFLNSNGMDIKINNTAETGQYLEYNTLGGVFDFYFLAGPSPKEVASQYAQTVGYAAMMPYWGFGFHQCRYGMQDVYEVAAVVANYSLANIPLETMWTDIDYMQFRRVFTLDPLRFPLNLMQQLVEYLHSHQQHYVVMVDPAVAYLNYTPFIDGVRDNAFLKRANGSLYQGVVWPGATVFPDWFASGTQGYWNGEFDSFFSPTTGVDIDALWIDMNEASNFCPFPCTNPAAYAIQAGDPPWPPPVRLGSPYPIPGFPADFQPQCVAIVSFNVTATTTTSEGILISGNSTTLGVGMILDAVVMHNDGNGVWSVVVQMPPNSVVTYQYVRSEGGANYTYEATTRHVTTGRCDGTTQVVNDVFNTVQEVFVTGSNSSIVTGAVEEVMGTPHMPRQELGVTPGSMIGLPGRNLLFPPYHIDDAAGNLSSGTLDTSLIHAGGYTEYDTHNLYGTMMSAASRIALLSRRPTVRPLVITRSTFAGAGAQVGHWLGDNVADWFHYRISIAEMLEFAALFQIPMVGADVCGYLGTVTPMLCARWATLGAFSPFFRNHEVEGAPPHEFYRYPLVAEAARNAIASRYKLLDYIYTALWTQNQTGIPLLNPMFFNYPNDANTFALQYQYFYGNAILVAPVIDENSTSVDVYFPNDLFYDFYTYRPVRGHGATVTLSDVPFTTIPLYIVGGNIVPLRVLDGAYTTTDVRSRNFDIVIAPGLDGKAQGMLYLDDGDSLVQAATSEINFNYANGVFTMGGKFGYDVGGVKIQTITLLRAGRGGMETRDVEDKSAEAVAHNVDLELTREFSIRIG